MRLFTGLYNQLDAAKSASDKIAALKTYFNTASHADAAWAVALLIGNAPARAVSSRELREWAAQAASLPAWLFERCYEASGDLSETAALLVRNANKLPASSKLDGSSDAALAWWIEVFAERLRGLGTGDKQTAVSEAWKSLNTQDRIVLNKLLTGTFRARIRRSVVELALAEMAGEPRAVIAQRLSAGWQPTAEAYKALIAPHDHATGDNCGALPFHFQPITAVNGALAELGDPGEWQAEWAMQGGMRVQLVRRSGCVAVWSSEQAKITDSVPQLAGMLDALPDDTVIEGALTNWSDEDNCPLPGAGSRLSEQVRFFAADLLQLAGRDLRLLSLGERRNLLEQFACSLSDIDAFRVWDVLVFDDWDDLQTRLTECRSSHCDGIVLKRTASPYGGDFDQWRLVSADPHEINAVLLYAEAARGQAASRFTNYTFGVWGNPGGERVLIPIAKTPDGLSDADRRRVDQFVLQHTKERHGPVRVVEPNLAVRLHFDAVEPSSRHKSGLTLVAPRAVVLLPNLPADSADTLEMLRHLTRYTGAKSTTRDAVGQGG